ncbi:succinylglutamate desuccinylase/aspartoacylase family protein [Fulvivirga sediminis]|uniref:Succinylglutamate desuccinylase/aspartoacylase family protein n=1 Tax=Fulvivirga sediminis TaxID=2803949 RepID=A0A937F8Z4_9BACT|nr:M14 family metallopeptidase [Fulvivirga sediminis]MBL3657217.1 succinylglutamate desuccinylase/aspartoacylase family protein [Fulvivirga sediminis]
MTDKKILSGLMLIWFLMAGVYGQAQVKSFDFAGEAVSPGSKKSFMLPIISGQDSTFIPVTVFHGADKGPVLTITAGVHGYEYPPIMAGQRLIKQLDPKQMSGTVLIVQVANVAGFLGRSININPLDGKNLNREFPGKKDGTLTEQLAWTIANQIIARSDYMIDVHAGDAYQDLRSYVGYYNYYKTPELSEKARQMAVNMGFDYVVQFGNTESIDAPSIYCSREAIKRGIPAVDIECGRMGLAEEKYIQKIVSGLLSLTRHLGIMPGAPDKVENPVMIAQRTSIDAPETGIFYTEVSAGDYVKKGMKLGYLTDLFGEHITDIICPVDGFILYNTTTPPTYKDDELFSIGHIKE